MGNSVQPMPGGRRSSAFADYVIGPAWLTLLVSHHARMESSTHIEIPEFRKRASKKATFGFCGAIAIIAPLVVLSNDGYIPKSVLWAFLAAVPFAYYVIGTIELITLHPFREMTRAWQALQRRQKAALCMFLVLVGSLVFILGVASVFNVWIIARGDG